MTTQALNEREVGKIGDFSTNVSPCPTRNTFCGTRYLSHCHAI